MMKSERGSFFTLLGFASLMALLLAGCSPAPTALPCSTAVIAVTKFADTYDGVCSGADCSLREAVILSNTCAGTQTISIPSGTYSLTRVGAGEDSSATGDLDISDSVRILGVGNPVIDGNRTDRVFDVKPGPTVDMTGLTVRHGQSDDGGGIRSHGILRLHNMTLQENTVATPADPATGPTGGGGAILSEKDGTLTMDGSRVIGNSAYQGGGIAAYPNATPSLPRSRVEIRDTVIAENSAASSGGGLYLYVTVTVTLTNVEIRDNSAASSRGDGLWNGSTLNMDRVWLHGNHGGIYGGGIYNYFAGNLTATNALIENNLARFGGGIYNEGAARFYRSLFFGNEAERGQGGAIYNNASDAVLTLNNSTLSENQASLGGGGIRNNGGSYQISFSTIALNESEGINGSGAGEMTIRNSILADNIGGNCAGALPGSIGFNIDSANTCGFIEPSDLVLTAPLLEPLAANGGPTRTHALGAASPAIDTADPDRCEGIDQRGVARPQGPWCDRGAFEFEGTPAPRATSTPTFMPSLTPSLSPVSAGLSFLQPRLSTGRFYYYSAACGPEQVTLQTGVSDPAKVFSLGVFFRSVEKSSSTANPWSGGFAMSPTGGGMYSFTVPATDVPGYNLFTEAWFQYQFVANDAGGNPILRSVVYSDITLSRCDKK